MSYTYNLKEAIKLFIEAPAVAGVVYLFSTFFNGIYVAMTNYPEMQIFGQYIYPLLASMFIFAFI